MKHISHRHDDGDDDIIIIIIVVIVATAVVIVVVVVVVVVVVDYENAWLTCRTHTANGRLCVALHVEIFSLGFFPKIRTHTHTHSHTLE